MRCQSVNASFAPILAQPAPQKSEHISPDVTYYVTSGLSIRALRCGEFRAAGSANNDGFVPIRVSGFAFEPLMINLGRSLDLTVIAEGVENEAQREFLMAEGCYLYQGFLYSPAVSPLAFEAFVASSNSTGNRQLVHGRSSPAARKASLLY